MKHAHKNQVIEACTNTNSTDGFAISELVKESWQKIAPFWPLKNLIAVNPLQGLEDLPFEEALRAGEICFEASDLPKPMADINRESIKWLQAFFDEGQATIAMPNRALGLYRAWRQMAMFDTRLHQNEPQKTAWLAALPVSPEQAIGECLLYLSLKKEDRADFLSLMLTTLPGWAAHVKYRTEWSDDHEAYPVSQTEYLAFRLTISCLIWPDAKALMPWHRQVRDTASADSDRMGRILAHEAQYRPALLSRLASQTIETPHTPKAQLVFCIDVRSEPFRRALEAVGDYETFGFAGFFVVPVRIEEAVSGESYASCPVLLKPKHTVCESPCGSAQDIKQDHQGFKRLRGFKSLYQSLKYNFTTPFALVEALGLPAGLWMGMRSFAPAAASRLKAVFTSMLRPKPLIAPSLETISLAEQCAYAEGALRMMGLTQRFAPQVVFCGHGSVTQNNAYATALDCGACGGRHGGSNARILANMLNSTEVRGALLKKGIAIPETTRFLAAEHNTTSDAVRLLGTESDEADEALLGLRHDLEMARDTNSQWRCAQMGVPTKKPASRLTWLRSQDWAQARPEWGLARNAAFVIGPRACTKHVDLEGRCFLHSYDARKDPDGASLTAILTAPMVVAHWIYTHYLFSTLNNVAYGGGSKITKNITGKIGIMQGNASDLMTGLPLQSVFSNDDAPYHEPQRLMTVVFAPRAIIDPIIKTQPILQKLFGKGWTSLACIEPDKNQTYLLQRDLTWLPTAS